MVVPRSALLDATAAPKVYVVDADDIVRALDGSFIGSAKDF